MKAEDIESQNKDSENGVAIFTTQETEVKKLDGSGFDE